MKNSWGTNRPHKGLEYVSFDEFRKETLAIELPSSAN
jgi:bleomycin hydrolase